ncbi:hypothetical protein HHK36_018071 [Tetracentron sinense]|uniref:Myb-like domain-containing protein n=1 Tax=Tetracentron sinense TaxID=13715 RepID=A0A835DD64_TETSI|nr:hypothetical protein HHK36_018071 [Tetracentron sinense]
MEMRDQYGLPILGPLLAGRTHFPTIPYAAEQFSGHQNLTTVQHYQMIMVDRQMDEVLPRQFPSSSTATFTTSAAALCGLEMEGGCIGAEDGNGRWPRQETLTLLEIRSRLDHKFKEANQKGLLWDEVSRIMEEEHGYKRSGKKCREKFENLYKYYKKTKEGNAGRQDGKHYRFFRQLEALYGETSNPVSLSESHLVGNSLQFHTMNPTTQANDEGFHAQKLCVNLSLSNSSGFDTLSSENDNNLSAISFMENEMVEKKKKMKDSHSLKRVRRNSMSKITDFIDSQMRKLMETQEAWLEKMLMTLEQKEQERILREVEWKKQDEARFDQAHKFWANERAWVKARDAALMEAMQKFTRIQLKASSREELIVAEFHDYSENQNENQRETTNNTVQVNRWSEPENSSLIQQRTTMESRFQQSGCSKEALQEKIAAKMACAGYDGSAMRCKEKWENINNYFKRTKECNKKSKENSRTYSYFDQDLNSLNNQGEAYCSHDSDEQGPETVGLQADGSPYPNYNPGNTRHDSCFRFLGSEEEDFWGNYGLKMNKRDNQ